TTALRASPVDLGMDLWVRGNALKHVANPVDELAPQASPAVLIPCDGVVVLVPGFAEEPEGQIHWRRRAKASASTCSPDIAELGSARNAASRRSISCFCASVNGASSMSAAMLSQIAPTSFRRSSTLSLSIGDMDDDSGGL